MESEDMNSYNIFLEKLRQSGVTNMYGATPYLIRKFEIDHDKAKDILTKWIREYRQEDYKQVTITEEEMNEFLACPYF